jgi:hypothetical protein
MGDSPWSGSTLDATESNALDEVALKERIDHQDWNCGNEDLRCLHGSIGYLYILDDLFLGHIVHGIPSFRQQSCIG